MKIKDATKKDRLKISKLNIAEPYYKFNPANKAKEPIPIEKPRFKNIILVAREKEQIIGFILANFIHYCTSRYGYIEELYVNKENRNKGVGSALIKEVMKKFKMLKVEAVFVSTAKENKESIKLYQRLGFKLCKGLWFYWNPKEAL